MHTMSEQKNRPDGTPRRIKRELWQTRSAEKVRRTLRNEFIDRLKQTRCRNVDKLRAVLDKYGDDVNFQSVTHMRKTLQHDNEAFDLLIDEDVNRILEEIEQAILEEEAKEQNAAEKNEAEDILERHLVPCSICGNLSVGGNLCQVCVEGLNQGLKNV